MLPIFAMFRKLHEVRPEFVPMIRQLPEQMKDDKSGRRNAKFVICHLLCVISNKPQARTQNLPVIEPKPYQLKQGR
jgi:hypothetical protein